MVRKAALAILLSIAQPVGAQPANSGASNTPDMRCDSTTSTAPYFFCAGRINGFLLGYEMAVQPAESFDSSLKI